MLHTTEARTLEILAKIKTVFGQKGFDGASMQDLARAADMSVGNFYRYFASKDAIIAAMVQQDLSDVGATFAQIQSSGDPRAAFMESMRRELTAHIGGCDGPLWAEIEAASARRPQVAAITREMERAVTDFLLQTFALIAGRPVEEMTPYTDHARLIIVLFKGIGMQPDSTPSLVDLTLGIVDHLLDDIIAASAARPAMRVATP